MNTLIHGSKRSLVGKQTGKQAGKQISRPAAAAVAVLLLILFGAGSLQAQSTHRVRRETTANRKARIARTIDQTYSHRWEAAAGGGYMRYRSGQFLQQNNEVTFWATTQYSYTQKFGLLGEVTGAYGRAKIGNTIYNIPNPQISEYAFLAGPSYRLVQKERFGVTGFVTAGLDLGKFAGGSKGFTAEEIGVWSGDYAPAFSAGVSLDLNLYPNVALRATPQYIGTTFGSTIQNSKALNVGIVYRFGKIK